MKLLLGAGWLITLSIYIWLMVVFFTSNDDMVKAFILGITPLATLAVGLPAALWLAAKIDKK